MHEERDIELYKMVEIYHELYPSIPIEKIENAIKEYNQDDEKILYYLSNISSTEEIISPIKLRKINIRPIETKNKPVTIICDLHGFAQIDAAILVERYLLSIRNGESGVIRFIIGKGKHSNKEQVLDKVVFHVCKKLKFKASFLKDNNGIIVVPFGD